MPEVAGILREQNANLSSGSPGTHEIRLALLSEAPCARSERRCPARLLMGGRRGCGLCGLCHRAGIAVSLRRAPTHALGHDSRRERAPHRAAGGRPAPPHVRTEGEAAQLALKGGRGRAQRAVK